MIDASGTGPIVVDELASSAQMRFWLLHELSEQPGALALALSLVLDGRIAESRLRRALDAIVDRHEALRTRFVQRPDGSLRQVVVERVDPILQMVDLRELEDEERDQRVRELVSANKATPFDLEEGVLLRARVALLGERRAVLLIAVHHIAADAWSVRTMMRELSHLYNVGTELPAPRKQYRDVAADERGWLASQEADEELDQWLRVLEPAPAVTPLPGGAQRPASRSFLARVVPLPVTGVQAEQIDSLARHLGATRFMVLLAALARMLHRTTGATGIVVGTPSGGRPDAAAEDVVGPMINTLALGLDVPSAISFEDLVLRARDVTLAALTHARLPFERVVAALNPARDPSYAPLCQIMLILQDDPARHLDLAGVRSTRLERTGQQTSELDLTFVLDATGPGLQGELEYADDVYDETAAMGIAACFVDTLADGLAERPLR